MRSKLSGVWSGQAVNQVHVDAAISPAPRVIHQPRGLLAGLDAVDRLLHVVIEVLHAERDAVEAERRQRVEMLACRHARVGLERELGAGQRREVPQQSADQLVELRGRVVRGRAAAEMQLRELPALGELAGEQLDLAAQHSEVGNRDVLARRDDRVAAAEEAALLAERQVHVQRERRVAQRVRGGEALEVVVLADTFVELHRRRVARVARPRTVVSREEIDGDRALDGTRGCRDGRLTGGGVHVACSACTTSTRACTLSWGPPA